MQTTILGRTGLRVTTAGLGCGGFSRIGMRSHGVEHAGGIVRAAYDAGVTFFDTASAYGTQPAVGLGLRGLPRDSYTLSTKFTYFNEDGIFGEKQVLDLLEQSLRELETDYIDVYQFHALQPEHYAQARDTIMAVLERAKKQGKIRFIGATEQFVTDRDHQMFKLALPDDLFDVIMTGYNILNPSAAKTILPAAVEKNLGVLCMFAVRQALWDTEQLKRDIARILASGQGGEGLNENSLDFLVEEGIAKTLPEAAYRFCVHTPGISVTLTGTGNHDHLQDNLRTLELPPLPDSALERLEQLFGNVDCVSGQDAETVGGMRASMNQR